MVPSVFLKKLHGVKSTKINLNILNIQHYCTAARVVRVDQNPVWNDSVLAELSVVNINLSFWSIPLCPPQVSCPPRNLWRL